MSVLLLLCTKLTFFCTELPKHCIYLSQSELINFFMYITRLITINWRRFINMFPDFMVYCFYGIVFLLWHCLYLQRLFNHFPCYWREVSRNTKKASKKERVHGLHILLYALCLAFFRQRLSLSKNSPQEDVMSALVTVADSSFLGNVISSRGLLQHSMNVNVCLIRYSFFSCISSIPFLLFFGMIFLSKINCVLYWNSILDNCGGRFYLIMWSNDVTSAEVLCSVKRQRCIVVVSTSI